MSQTMPPPLFDPFAPGFTDDPYPQYAAVRAGAPVAGTRRGLAAHPLRGRVLAAPGGHVGRGPQHR